VCSCTTQRRAYELYAARLDAVHKDLLSDDEGVRVLGEYVGGAGPPVDAGFREAAALVLHDEAVHGAGRPTVRLRLQQQVRPAQRGGEVIEYTCTRGRGY
jgi:hypothetical protein